MRSDNFNEAAMELKIKKNRFRGFTNKKLLLALMNEYMAVLEQTKPLQIRAVELSDQIDYMKEKHPIKKEKKMKRVKLAAMLLFGLLAFSLPAEAVTYKSITYREHATDCTSLTDGKSGHYCWELDQNVIYKCVPSVGACDTAGEWDVVVPLTANALAANPADCAANQFAETIAANGDLGCLAIVDADVPNDITIDLAALATALAANGGNCSAGSYPLGVDASGAVESCTDASTETDSIVATHAAISTAHHTATVEINNLETVATDMEVNEILTGTASNTGVYKLLPDCNVAGSALNYENSTQVWSCRSGLGGGSFDSTTVDSTTWSDGANASNVWTFDVSGTDHTMTIGSNSIVFSGDVSGNNLSGTNTGDNTVATSGDSATSFFPSGTLETARLTTSMQSASFGITIDGGGSAITTGVKGYIEVPFAMTIDRAAFLCDQSGSIVVDVWKDTYANYPPTDADSITASAPPTITTATKSEDETLTGWTTSVTAEDILGFNVDSITAVERCHLIISGDKT